MANVLDLQSKAQEIEDNLGSREFTLGKGLLQPFNETNSGSRKIMQGIHKEQTIQLCKSEYPIISTGYENQYGELSSTFVTADSSYVVVDKIYKNKNKYCILLYDITNNLLHSIIRNCYEYCTEVYGFDINTDYIDHLNKGDTIDKGTPLIKSASFDDYNNKTDGVNLSIMYLALGITTEDPIVVSESAAKKLSSPSFDTIDITINENDIPLNIYGDDNNYKSFPDIGETIEKNILCAIRRERKEDEALYSQARSRLKELMISDDVFISKGEVLDIEIYCNNPDKLNNMYYQQLKKYYDSNMEYSVNMYRAVDEFMKTHNTCKMSYDLQKEYSKCKDIANNVLYIKDKVFNNIMMKIVTRNVEVLRPGDKITDRYGGKGVVSKVIPDELMPHYYRNDKYYPVDTIYNSSTIINRINPGQSFETELNYISSKILEHIGYIWSNAKSIDYNNGLSSTIAVDEILNQCEDIIYKFISMVNKEEADDWIDIQRHSSVEQRRYYIESMIEEGYIALVIVPLKNTMTIDRLKDIYNEFPWIKPEYVYMPQKDSMGNYRRVKSRRPVIVGKKYIYKMKQVAKEHFSVVSLASTNIRGENTKTKANKLHISPISKTPVKLGNMEVTELMQISECQYVIENIMLLSTSPTARRLVKKLLVGDPFDRNIELDENARSRSAEIVNAYLKCLGIRLVFEKIDNHAKSPILIEAVKPFMQDPYKNILMRPFNQLPYYLTYIEYNELYKKLEYIYKKKTNIKQLSQNDNIKIYDKIWNLIWNSNGKEELEKSILNMDKFDDLITAVCMEPIILLPNKEDIIK